MQLTEQHVIDEKDPRYAAIDKAAFASKNLYNATLYIVRQIFIFEEVYLNYNAMDTVMQKHETYRELPTKVAQRVVKQVHDAWISFFEACKEYKEHPEKFTGRPKLPGYKDKTTGRNMLVYTLQALRGGRSKKGMQRAIQPCDLAIKVTTQQDPKSINEVRIVPRHGHYVVEIVYTQEEQQAELNPAYIAGIDVGVNNLVALTSNKPGFQPVVVNGRPVKSTNQFYNKRRAELQKALTRKGSTKRMDRLTNKRNRRIEHYMHTASRMIIDILVKEGIGTLVIGKNDGWKQNVNIGKKNNQNFCQIPHAKLISMLTYKAELVGITVVLTEESYTSVASFLDGDPLPKWKPNNKTKYKFSGKRVKRGLYRTSDKRLINADVNGSMNIIRKAAPKAFESRVVEGGFVVHPRRIVIPRRSQKVKSQAVRANVTKR